MGLVEYTAASRSSVTISEFALHQRIQDDELEKETAWINDRLMAADSQFGNDTGRQVCTATFDYYLDEFPDDDELLELPRPPLQTVTSILYLDGDSVWQTLAAATYEVTTTRDPGGVRLAYSQTWPTTLDHPECVIVRYIAGWSPDAVPPRIKGAVCSLVGHWYEHRESVITGTIVTDMPLTYRTTVWSYKVPGVPTA